MEIHFAMDNQDCCVGVSWAVDVDNGSIFPRGNRASQEESEKEGEAVVSSATTTGQVFAREWSQGDYTVVVRVRLSSLVRIIFLSHFLSCIQLINR